MNSALNLPRVALGCASLGLLIAGCAAEETSIRLQVEDLVRHGEYEAAVAMAADYAAGREDEEEALEIHQQASVAFILGEARRATFDGRDEDALALVSQALELDPASATARQWDLKLNSKLAGKWFERAREVHAQDNLDGAIVGYEKVLEYDPEHNSAQRGLARALVQRGYRLGLSEEYYNDGVRSFFDYYLEIARGGFRNSKKYRPEDPRVKRRLEEVEILLARQRIALADKFAQEGKHAAARNEYRLALLLDPENEEAQRLMEAMGIEAEADKLFQASKMSILRGEMAKAREYSESGLQLTVTQKERFESLIGDIGDARLRQIYDEALDAEHDFRYEEAIRLFDELLSETDWFEDARTRHETLSEYVQRAASLYSRALEESGEEQTALLREIEIFWPEYRDIRARLQAAEPH